MRRDTKHARAHVELILAALPGTNQEISERTGRTVVATKHRLRVMRAESVCHVGGWKRSVGAGGKFQPVIHAGPGKDAPCLLKALSVTAYYQRYRKKYKGTEHEELRKAKDRARFWKKKAMAEGDPLINALFGKPSERRV